MTIIEFTETNGAKTLVKLKDGRWVCDKSPSVALLLDETVQIQSWMPEPALNMAQNAIRELVEPKGPFASGRVLDYDAEPPTDPDSVQ